MGTAADIAKMLAALLIRLYPSCFTTVEVGDVWETRHRSDAVYAMPGRDNDLAARVIQIRWKEYPRARVISAMCVR